MLERPLPHYRRNSSAASIRSVQVKRFKLVHDESADEFERGEVAAGGGGANMCNMRCTHFFRATFRRSL